MTDPKIMLTEPTIMIIDPKIMITYPKIMMTEPKIMLQTCQDFLSVAVAAPWARAISHNGVPYYIKWGPHFDDDDGDDGDGDDAAFTDQ